MMIYANIRTKLHTDTDTDRHRHFYERLRNLRSTNYTIIYITRAEYRIDAECARDINTRAQRANYARLIVSICHARAREKIRLRAIDTLLITKARKYNIEGGHRSAASYKSYQLAWSALCSCTLSHGYVCTCGMYNTHTNARLSSRSIALVHIVDENANFTSHNIAALVSEFFA